MDLKDYCPAWIIKKITVSQICSFILLSPTVIIFAPNYTPIVTSCFCLNRWSINCSKRHDLPTPKNELARTSITDDDELKHVRKRHPVLCIKNISNLFFWYSFFDSITFTYCCHIYKHHQNNKKSIRNEFPTLNWLKSELWHFVELISHYH